MAPAGADVTSSVSLPYSQNWANTELITANDMWGGVPGVQGYLGDVDPGSPADVDARTVTVENTTTDVIANQANPNTLGSGGVAEFDRTPTTDPVVALQGSGTADAPNLVFRADTTARQNLAFSFNARDIDGAADNAVQQVAVQYRVGTAGPYTRADLPATAGYVADATTGPSLATLVTPVNVTLPDATDNQAAVFLRVLTTNATGSDEWVGIDDVSITSEAIAGNQPPVVTCGATLALAQGEAGTREVTASDSDGTVDSLTLGTITPAPSPSGAITIGPTTAENEAPPSPASAVVSVADTLAPGTYTVPVNAENDGGSPGSCTLTVTVTAPTPPRLISAVQGVTGDDPNNPTGYVSPRVGETVTIEGVVTGHDDENGASNSNPMPGFPDDRGIYVQEEVSDEDGNPRSSEGIFVGNVTSPLFYAIGNRVRLTGVVVEKFGVTQINVTTSTQPSQMGAVAPAQVPAATPLDEAASEAQATLAADIPGECRFPSDICREGRRAYYERFEGMNVTLPVGVANSGGVNGFAEAFFTPGPQLDPVLVAEDVPGTTDPGVRGLIGAINDAGAGNPLNLQKDQSSTTNLAVDHQDRVENLRGPLNFSFGNYKIVPQVGALPVVVKGPTEYPFNRVPDQPANSLRATFFNVENFFPTGGDLDGAPVNQAEFENKRDRIADAVSRLLKRPDIVGLEEVGGLSDTSTGMASLQALANRLGGYTPFLLRGRDNRFIDVAFLVKDGVAATNLRQFGLNADESIAGTNCSDVAPKLYDRPPLAIDFSKQGVSGTAIVNHFSSKAAPDSCRLAQAAFLEDEVAALEAAGREVIVGGDLNAFEFETPLLELTDGETSLTNQILDVPAAQRFSFQFGGRLQVLDHILVTDGLEPRVTDTRFAHFDNEYYDRTLINDGAGCSGMSPPPVCTDGHKVSDHDPPLITLSLPAPATPVATCGPELTLAERTAGMRQVTASDSDGTVDALTLGEITPALSPAGSITIGATTAERETPAEPASAVVSVAGTLAPGTYSVPVIAENDGGTPGRCTLTVTVTPAMLPGPMPPGPTLPGAMLPGPILPTRPVAKVASFNRSPKSLWVSKTGRFSYPFRATPLSKGRLSLKSTRSINVPAKVFRSPFTGRVRVRFRLSRRALKTLKRLKKVSFVVTAVLDGKRFTTKLTLRAPKRPSRRTAAPR